MKKILSRVFSFLSKLFSRKIEPSSQDDSVSFKLLVKDDNFYFSFQAFFLILINLLTLYLFYSIVSSNANHIISLIWLSFLISGVLNIFISRYVSLIFKNIAIIADKDDKVKILDSVLESLDNSSASFRWYAFKLSIFTIFILTWLNFMSFVWVALGKSFTFFKSLDENSSAELFFNIFDFISKDEVSILVLFLFSFCFFSISVIYSMLWNLCFKKKIDIYKTI